MESISQILKKGKPHIEKNIKIVLDDFDKINNNKGLKTKVCRTCPTHVNMAIAFLIEHYKVRNFKLAKISEHYKINQSDNRTISNPISNDDAVEFLKVKPARILLFSKFPDNWKQLTGLDLIEEAEAKILLDSPEPKTAEKEAKALSLQSSTLKQLRKEFKHIEAKTHHEFIEKIVNDKTSYKSK